MFDRTRPRPTRRTLLSAASALSVGVLASGLHPLAHAQSAWPDERPIRLVVPYAAGGFADTRARQLATRLSKALGQQIVVDNKGGAGGVIGTDAVAKAKPAGYTLGTGHPAPLSVNPSLMKSLPYDPAKDIAPIILVEKSPLILMVGAGLKTSDVAAIIAAARSKPGELTFASSGVGGAHHLSGELFANIADIQLTHVPYKGGAPASADLMGGQVSMMFEMGYAALPSIQSGKARPVAVTSNHRLDILPDVPTMAEAGVKDFESYNWQGIIGPAGLPEPIIERLNKELNTILADPEMKQLITSSGGDVVGGTPEAFGKWIHDEAVKWGAVVKAAKIEPQ